MDRGFAPLRIVLGFLVIGVVALLGFLIFQGVKPTIKNPQPLNGSRTPKGEVTISAEVRGEANLKEVILTIDGRKVEPIITTHSERFWEVRYQAALPKGTHQAEIVAIDTRGRESPYSWSFNASGPTNPPKFANPLPRNGAKLPPGETLISLATFSELSTINSYKLSLDGSSLVSNPDIREGAGERTTAQVRRTLTTGEHKVTAEAIDQEGEKATYEWRFIVAADAASADTIFFKETDTYVFAPFAEYWTKNGGLPIFGYPITPDFEQSGRTVQWFERARFELNATAPVGQQVQLGLLGYEVRKNGDPPLTASPAADRRFFAETGHSLGGAFRTYWDARGGIAIFGLPITEEIVENGRTVQWFERARFEFHPQAPPDQQVQLGQIGRTQWERSGPR
jgi:hypothetical protein